MMNKKISILITAILVFTLLLVSCGGTGGCVHVDSEGDLKCDLCGEALPDPNLDGKILYSVKVVDSFGAPKANVIVEIYDGEKKIATKLTNAEGSCACSKDYPVDAGENPFTVKLLSADGKALNYDETKAVISDGAEDIVITVFDTLANLMKDTLYLRDSDVPVEAPVMPEGGYRVDLTSGINYFIFPSPSVRGQYKISCTSEGVTTLGYFGSPHFVQSNNIAALDGTGDVFLADGSLYFNIRAFNIGEDYYSGSRYVFGVDAEADTTAYITISCVDSNLPLSKEEMPWEEYPLSSAPETYVPDFTVGSSSELTPVPITDPSFVAVYNETDGFYHVGSADGPVILVKLTVESDYFVSFEKMMETTPFSAYVYDENGNLSAKKNYHSMMQQYIDAADETLGVYPLTEALKEAITVVGNAKGWFEGAGSIFTGKVTEPVVSEIAYLFACCYYSEN